MFPVGFWWFLVGCWFIRLTFRNSCWFGVLGLLRLVVFVLVSRFGVFLVILVWFWGFVYWSLSCFRVW